MRNDVKALIAALTTERNAIDRAIAWLQQMSDVRQQKVERPQATTALERLERNRAYMREYMRKRRLKKAEADAVPIATPSTNVAAEELAGAF